MSSARRRNIEHDHRLWRRKGLSVVWLLEEMGLAYRLRSVDLLAGVENDAEYLAINPAGFIPAVV
jgi:glutathione S-transferase